MVVYFEGFLKGQRPGSMGVQDWRHLCLRAESSTKAVGFQCPELSAQEPTGEFVVAGKKMGKKTHEV